jgi:hypothetical protein
LLIVLLRKNGKEFCVCDSRSNSSIKKIREFKLHSMLIYDTIHTTLWLIL